MESHWKKQLFNSVFDHVKKLIIPLISIFLSLGICAVIISVMGIDPLLAYQSLIKGSLGSKNAIAETLVKMSPLVFTGLSFALAFRCGLINIGAEGQLYMGAFFSIVAGIYIQGLPFYIHLPLALIAGIVGGGLWGLIVGILKVKYGANEIITTVMFNYVAIYWVSLMVNGPLKEPPGTFPHSAPIAVTAELPRIMAGTRLHFGIILAIIALLLYYIFLWRTSKGYEVRVAGLNYEGAKYAGMKTGFNILLIMFLAGAMGGLAGSVEVLGIQKRLLEVVSSGYGFDGIAVALLGLNTPVGILFGALLFGVLRSGGNMMQMVAEVPVAIIYVVQALVIIFVVAGQMIKPNNRKFLKQFFKKFSK